jgi:lysozyme
MNEELTYSKTGEEMTERFESCNLRANWDAIGSRWQIGWCHTGPDVHVDDVITQDEANRLLLHDCEVAQSAIYNFVTVQLTQNEFDALVDFIYNVGVGNFRNSTLRTLLNQGNFALAAKEFDRWDLAGGKIVAGLLRRRQAETDLFSSGGVNDSSSNLQAEAAQLLQKSNDLVQRINAAANSGTADAAGSPAGPSGVSAGQADAVPGPDSGGG